MNKIDYTVLEQELFEKGEWEYYIPEVEVAPSVPLRCVAFKEGSVRVIRLLPSSVALQVRPLVPIHNFNPEYVQHDETALVVKYEKAMTLVEKSGRKQDLRQRGLGSKRNADDSNGKELLLKLEQLNLEILVVDQRSVRELS